MSKITGLQKLFIPSTKDLTEKNTPKLKSTKDLVKNKDIFTHHSGYTAVPIGNAVLAYNLQNVLRDKILFKRNSEPYLELNAEVSDDLILNLYTNKYKPDGGYDQGSILFEEEENLWEKTTGIKLTKLF